MIFQAGNVHESASLFIFKEKNLYERQYRIRFHDLDGPVYYPNHVQVHIASTPTPKKNLTSFETMLSPNQ